MKKILVGLSIIVACGVAYLAANANNYKPLFITYGKGENQLKFEVPEGIVKAKDCSKFDAFQKSLKAPPMFSPVPCPWEKAAGKIGKFTLNGVEFHVPRAYLWQQSREPNGPVEALYLHASWPNFEPTSKDTPREHNILITINAQPSKEKCSTAPRPDNCENPEYGSYISHMHLYECVEGNNCPLSFLKPDSNDNLHVVKEHKDLGLTQVVNEKYNPEYEKHFYKGPSLIKGDLNKPDYVLYCPFRVQISKGERLTTQLGKGCRRIFKLSEKINVQYSFNRKSLLNHHDEINQKLTEMINNFIQK